MTNKRKAASGAVVLLAVAAATTYFATTTTAQPSPLIIIVMENKSYVNLTSHAAFVPYELGLADQGRRFTHYSESPSPSLPNYLLMASGETCDKAGTDAITAGQITVCPTTVWNQLESAGVSWSVYMDDMPSPRPAPATTKNLTATAERAIPTRRSTIRLPRTRRSTATRRSARPTSFPTPRSTRRPCQQSASYRRGYAMTSTARRTWSS